MPLGAVLDEVTRVVAAGRLPMVVLDLDSTLFDTAARHLRILREFAEATPDERLRSLVADVGVADLGYRVDGPLVARGYDDEAVLAALHDFWEARFFTSEYCLLDHPAPGAVAFARRIVETGGLVYYLTGRPVGDMLEGTLRSLRQHGFPALRGRAVLHMKPGPHLDDRRFKAHAIAEITSLQGTVVATVENEPVHARQFLEAFPSATHFLFGTIRSPGAPEPHPELVCIESFHV